MGDCINRVFYNKMWGRFAQLEKSGRNIQQQQGDRITKVDVRWGSTVHVVLVSKAIILEKVVRSSFWINTLFDRKYNNYFMQQ